MTAQLRAIVIIYRETAQFYLEAMEKPLPGKVLRAWGNLPVPDEDDSYSPDN